MSDLLYGRNAVREALRAGRKIMRLYVAEPASGPPAAARPAVRRGGRPEPARPGTGRAGSGRLGTTRAGSGGRPGAPPSRSLPVQETRAERRVVAQAGRAPLESIVQLARGKGVPVDQVPGERLDKMTNGANHQGVAAVAGDYHYQEWDVILERIAAAGPRALVLLLDSLQDPQNFGTLLRTAEAVGVTAVVIPEHQSVGVTPAVCNASSGAVEYLHIARVTNMARTVEQLKRETGCWVYALSGDDTTATPWDKVDLNGALALVVGSEGRGVSALVRKRSDATIALPMHGRIESLNAAVAGSVMLYEVLRQRGPAE